MPKTWTAAILLSLLLTTTAYAQDEDAYFEMEDFGIEYCKWVSILAKDVMTARQQDKPMSETLPYALDRLNDFPKDMIELIAPESSEDLDDLDDVEQAEVEALFDPVFQELKPFITQMVMAAYEVPTFSTGGNQRDLISEFENTFFAGCYTDYEEEAAASVNQAAIGADAESNRLVAMQADAKAAYAYAIRQRIMNRWVQPPTATAGIECIVNIRQLPGGEVVSVSIGRCNGDGAVRRSIEAAVHSASPLPSPEDPSIFSRDIQLEFRPVD